MNAKTIIELCRVIDGQKHFYSPDQLAQLNMNGPRVEQITKNLDWAKTSLAKIGGRLKWGCRNGVLLPTTEKVARLVGKKEQYEFLYRATCKVVHFSPHELYRMVWGSPAEATISGKHYSKYWSLFTLYWGFKLWGELLETVVEHLEFPSASYNVEQKVLDAYQWLGSFPPPPIVTAAELYWPSAK